MIKKSMTVLLLIVFSISLFSCGIPLKVRKDNEKEDADQARELRFR